LRFELVAALRGFCAYFFGGLALSFLLFGLPVDFSLLMSAGCLLFGMLGISTRIVRSPLA
jgi:cell division protein FtsX